MGVVLFWKQVSLGYEVWDFGNFQDDKFRQFLGMEVFGRSVELYFDSIDSIYERSYGYICQFFCILLGVRGFCLFFGVLVYLFMGFFFLKGFRIFFVLIQIKNKGLDVLVFIRLEVNIVGIGINLFKGLGQFSISFFRKVWLVGDNQCWGEFWEGGIREGKVFRSKNTEFQMQKF